MASAIQHVSGQNPLGTSTITKRTAGQTSLENGRDGKKRFYGCSKISGYTIMSKLGEGTFGEVHKAEARASGEIFAMKKILMHNEKDGFPITALREIKLLKMLSHPNVLKLEEMAVERPKGEGRKLKAIMYMVTPYMDHDLSGLLDNPSVQFTEPQIKCYMLQLLQGVAYLHASKILHRDLKAANLLINNQGILQIADFGLARPYDDPPPQPGKGNGEATRDYTTLVVTRWYRPPELLLQLKRYTPAIDMWGVGCVFGEMFRGRPILPGNSDVNQAQLIFDLMGSPNEENMPGWSSLPGCEGVQTFQHRNKILPQVFGEQGPIFISLLDELLNLNWRKRINATDALEHPYFTSTPLPAKPAEIPQFQESHELDRKKLREQKANPPPAPAGGTVGMGPAGDFINGTGPVNHQGQHRPRGDAGAMHGDQQSYPPRNYAYDYRHSAPIRDFRGPPPPPNGAPPLSRRTAWPLEANGLPPRPPPPSNAAWAGQGHRGTVPRDERSGRMPARDRGGQSQVDTYIPSYANRDDGHRGRDEGQRREERNDRSRQGVIRRDQEHRDSGRRRSRSPDRDRDRNRELYRR